MPNHMNPVGSCAIANTACCERPSSIPRRSNLMGAAAVASRNTPPATRSSAAIDGPAHRAHRASVAFQHCNEDILTVIKRRWRWFLEGMLRTLLKRSRDWLLVRPGSPRCSGLALLTQRGRILSYENINAVGPGFPGTPWHCCLASLHPARAAAPSAPQYDLETVAEQSNFVRTGRYEEVQRLCEAFCARHGQTSSNAWTSAALRKAGPCSRWSPRDPAH